MNTIHIDEKDDLGIDEILNFFFKFKYYLTIPPILFALVFVFYSLSLDNTYTSKSLIKTPDENNQSSIANQYGGLADLAGINLDTANGDAASFAVAKLQSRHFVKHLSQFKNIKENMLGIDYFDTESRQIIFDSEIYNYDKKIWVRTPPKGRSKIPSYQEIHDHLYKENHLIISKDKRTNFITISFTHESPVFAAEFINLIINQLNEQVREEDLKRSERALLYLKNQLTNTPEIDIKDSINRLIESELKTQMYANINDFYLLEPIDPPSLPELKSGPTRSTIVLWGLLIGIIFGFLISACKQYLEKR